MRGLDIGEFSLNYCYGAEFGCDDLGFGTRYPHVAATAPHEQRRRHVPLTLPRLEVCPTAPRRRARVWASIPYLRAVCGVQGAVRLNRSLQGAPGYNGVLLISGKVTLKLTRSRIPTVNNSNSGALQHRPKTGRQISNSILSSP